VKAGNHRNRKGADSFAHFMNASDKHRRCLGIQARQLGRVCTAAEVAAATGDHHDSQRGELERFERSRQRRQHGGIQSVCFFRPVEEDTGDRIFEFYIHHAFIL
jgi:hypothetical protein